MTTMVLERNAAPRIAAIPRDDGVFLTAASDAAEPTSRTASIDELFDRLPIDTTGYVFNRDEANNYN